MAVTLKKSASVAVVLSFACASACTCPQPGASRSGRALGGDPSGGSLAFFGSLRSFFSESPSEESGGRTLNDSDLSDSDATTSATTAGNKAGAAALSIR